MHDDATYDSNYDGQDYKVKVTWSKSIREGDIELMSFYSLFFKDLMRKMSFEKVGRNCFNPKAAVQISQHNLEVWPGFYSAMQKLEIGPMIMIDLTNKVIRQDSVLSYINELLDKRKSREFINDELKFRVVVTSYGKTKSTYRVDRIDFDQSPECTFKRKDGSEVSYSQYY